MYYRKQHSAVLLYGQKDSMQKIFINICSLFTVGNICRESGSQLDWEDVRNVRAVARPVAEVAERTVKRLLICWFRLTGKAMGQVYQCWWRICREINVFFSVLDIIYLRFISIYDLFTDSPSYSVSILLPRTAREDLSQCIYFQYLFLNKHGSYTVCFATWSCFTEQVSSSGSNFDLNSGGTRFD
jgi:hypothetical protein